MVVKTKRHLKKKKTLLKLHVWNKYGCLYQRVISSPPVISPGLSKRLPQLQLFRG